MFHQPQGFSVAPWGSHTEITGDIFLDVPALLVAQKQHRLLAEAPETPHKGHVIGATPIPVQFNPFLTDYLDVIEAAGPLGMAGHLDLLGGG
jgi:hypothetical protein